MARHVCWAICFLGGNVMARAKAKKNRVNALKRLPGFVCYYFKYLFPLYSGRRLRTDVVNHTVDAANTIDNVVRDAR